MVITTHLLKIPKPLHCTLWTVTLKRQLDFFLDKVFFSVRVSRGPKHHPAFVVVLFLAWTARKCKWFAPLRFSENMRLLAFPPWCQIQRLHKLRKFFSIILIHYPSWFTLESRWIIFHSEADKEICVATVPSHRHTDHMPTFACLTDFNYRALGRMWTLNRTPWTENT